jgi:hypothetical protein
MGRTGYLKIGQGVRLVCIVVERIQAKEKQIPLVWVAFLKVTDLEPQRDRTLNR